MSVQPLTNVDRSTLRERALTALREAIMSGRYRPGDHLGEVDIASHLGVSRGTVREALRHLQQEGLVSAGNRNKLRVHTLTPVEVRELFRVRAALEGLAVTELITSSRLAVAVASLREAIGDLAATEGDFAAHIEADLGFHHLLCRLSGNSMLVESWQHLAGRMRVAIMAGEPPESPTMMSRERHSRIVDAIETGDAEQARLVVAQHMAEAAEKYAGSG